MSKRAVKMPSKLKLIDLKLTSADGKVEREIVALETITVFNLHRVFQLCLFPSKSDDAIAATPFTFKHRNKVVGGVKGTKLNQLDKKAGCEVGTTFTYQTGNIDYTVRVADAKLPAGQWELNYVPRCVDGMGANINLDKVNQKLLVRRFSVAGASARQFKQPPAVWCDARTPYEELMRGHLNAMRDPLR